MAFSPYQSGAFSQLQIAVHQSPTLRSFFEASNRFFLIEKIHSALAQNSFQTQTGTASCKCVRHDFTM
jgi:phosphopantetheine adenylyltransferase